MKLQPVRGTRDILAPESKLHNIIAEKARKLSSSFGYDEIILPIFEFSEVFLGSLGETSDILTKETYTFIDREKTSLTLRPEFTAQVVRALGTAGLLQTMPAKFFSYGPLFRHERPQKCRYRQFHQVNFEYFGCHHPAADIEVICLARMFLAELGLDNLVELQINSLGDAESRARYRQMLVDFLGKYAADLSHDSQKRLERNPLRILDSKDEKDREILKEAPKIEDSYTLEARQYYHNVLAGLDKLQIKYRHNPQLVRGLDYYNHTVFEFITNKLGSQGTVLAGGRYDNLPQQMHNTSFPIPAIGFASGVERLCALIIEENPNVIPITNNIAVVAASEQEELPALELANSLRKNGYCVLQEFGGNLSKKMKKANKTNCQYVIIIGAEEIRLNKLRLKNMQSGEEILLAKEELLGYLHK
jgi:histidyl-tRNA synthetase